MDVLPSGRRQRAVNPSGEILIVSSNLTASSIRYSIVMARRIVTGRAEGFCETQAKLSFQHGQRTLCEDAASKRF